MDANSASHSNPTKRNQFSLSPTFFFTNSIMRQCIWSGKIPNWQFLLSTAFQSTYSVCQIKRVKREKIYLYKLDWLVEIYGACVFQTRDRKRNREKKLYLNVYTEFVTYVFIGDFFTLIVYLHSRIGSRQRSNFISWIFTEEKQYSKVCCSFHGNRKEVFVSSLDCLGSVFFSTVLIDRM